MTRPGIQPKKKRKPAEGWTDAAREARGRPARRISLPKEAWTQLDAEAARRGISRSEMIGVAIENLFQKSESGDP